MLLVSVEIIRKRSPFSFSVRSGLFFIGFVEGRSFRFRRDGERGGGHGGCCTPGALLYLLPPDSSLVYYSTNGCCCLSSLDDSGNCNLRLLIAATSVLPRLPPLKI